MCNFKIMYCIRCSLAGLAFIYAAFIGSRHSTWNYVIISTLLNRSAEEAMEVDKEKHAEKSTNASVEPTPGSSTDKPVTISKQSPTPDKSSRRLSDRERGACDTLLQMRSPELLSPGSRSKSLGELPQDVLRRPSVAAEQEVGGSDPNESAEKDAILALLQMHEPNRVPNGLVPSEQKAKAAEETTQVSKAQYTTAAEHNYFQKPADAADTDQTDSASEGEQDLVPTLPPVIQMDHSYCLPFYPEADAKKPKREDRKKSESSLDAIIDAVIARSRDEYNLKTDDFLPPVPPMVEQAKPKKPRQRRDSIRKKEPKRLKDVTNLKEEPFVLPKPKPSFKPRAMQEELQVNYDFLINGIDEEDCNFLKRRYDELLGEDSPQTYWLNDTHWVDHTQTLISDPPKKKRKQEMSKKHLTGSYTYVY